jgi:geranylgeranyl diphosphate synthase type II
VGLVIALADPRAIDIAIEGSLARIRERTAELGSDAAALGEAISRAAHGGKRFRPALVTASFDAFRTDDAHASAALEIAAGFELLHTAFVIHDDVIDHDVVRRGIPNVGGEFRTRARRRGADADGAALLGDAAAILAGDLLLHEAIRLVSMADVEPAVREHLMALVDEAVYISAAGELADVANSVAADVTTSDEIFDAAFNKTAVYSFRAPLQAGAVLGGASAEALRVIGTAGGRIGLAFQLVDDLIGAFGTPDQAGRDTGGDLREAKRTPLVAFARDTDAWPHVDEALALARTGPVAVRHAQAVLESSGARRRVIDVIGSTLREVREISADSALPSAAADLLRSLADSIQARIP